MTRNQNRNRKTHRFVKLVITDCLEMNAETVPAQVHPILPFLHDSPGGRYPAAAHQFGNDHPKWAGDRSAPDRLVHHGQKTKRLCRLGGPEQSVANSFWSSSPLLHFYFCYFVFVYMCFNKFVFVLPR